MLIQPVLGHQQITTTETCAKVSDQNLRRAISRA